MLCNRIQQFREYNKLQKAQLAEILGIDAEVYDDFEKGVQVPSIDIIEKLARCYKVTVDEFYGYTPRLILHSKENEAFFDESVNESILKMSDLSWDEAKLILLYRNSSNKDQIIKMVSDEAENDE
ncbi:MAG: helix-turn-helix transcriptional regulator [Clostridia bacterium]|nr:helix-turn-helix transcriptional regulator [Clostridia bacterium]